MYTCTYRHGRVNIKWRTFGGRLRNYVIYRRRFQFEIETTSLWQNLKLAQLVRSNSPIFSRRRVIVVLGQVNSEL